MEYDYSGNSGLVSFYTPLDQLVDQPPSYQASVNPPAEDPFDVVKVPDAPKPPTGEPPPYLPNALASAPPQQQYEPFIPAQQQPQASLGSLSNPLPPGGAAQSPQPEARQQPRVPYAPPPVQDPESCCQRFWRSASPILSSAWQTARPILRMAACAIVIAAVFGGTYYTFMATERAIASGCYFIAKIGVDGLQACALHAALALTTLFQQAMTFLTELGALLIPVGKTILYITAYVLVDMLLEQPRRNHRYRY